MIRQFRLQVRLQWLVLVLVIVLTACTNDTASPENDDGKLQIVATVGQIGDLAERIGGDHVSVSTLMGAGIDPHQYVATEGDVERLQNADIIFYNGNFLEARMVEIFHQLSERKTVVPLTERIDQSQLLEWAQYKQYKDPHIWFGIPQWEQVAGVIRDTLIEVDPDHRQAYTANADAMLADMQELDAYVREQVARLPEAQRILVTAHDAFNYFGKTFGFQVRGLQGLSTDSEASTADVQTLAQFLVDNKIRAVFIESSVAVRNVEALREAAAAKGWDVVIGGQLFSDTIGTPGTPEGTYVGMYRHNINTIINALLGEE